MPDYTIPAEHRLTDVERAQLEHIAGLIAADHAQLWSDAALLRAACRASGRPVPDRTHSTRPDALAAVALNARALLQIDTQTAGVEYPGATVARMVLAVEQHLAGEPVQQGLFEIASTSTFDGPVAARVPGQLEFSPER